LRELAERLTGVAAGDGEHEQALASRMSASTIWVSPVSGSRSGKTVVKR
jgi:hypothetical protein